MRGLRHVQWFNCAVEQLTAYCVFNEVGVWPMPLLFQDELDPRCGRVEELGYTHMMGGKYHDTNVHNRLTDRMQREHGEIVERVSRLLQ